MKARLPNDILEVELNEKMLRFQTENLYCQQLNLGETEKIIKLKHDCPTATTQFWFGYLSIKAIKIVRQYDLVLGI